jgi:hypothetical protein
MAKSWMLPSSITGCDLSISMKNPLQAIKPLLAFNLKQQKTFIEVSSLWMNYLTTLAKNHREAYTNGGNGKTVLNGAFDASKDLFKSYTSLLDGHIEAVIGLYKSSCAAKNQPA